MKICRYYKEVVDMKKELLLNNLQGGTVFDKNQFKVIVRMTNPSYSDSSINWLLEKLVINCCKIG